MYVFVLQLHILRAFWLLLLLRRHTAEYPLSLQKYFGFERDFHIKAAKLTTIDNIKVFQHD